MYNPPKTFLLSQTRILSKKLLIGNYTGLRLQLHIDLFDCLGDFTQTIDNPNNITTLALHKGSCQYKSRLSCAPLSGNQRNISENSSAEFEHSVSLSLTCRSGLAAAKNQKVLWGGGLRISVLSVMRHTAQNGTAPREALALA